MNFFSFEDFFHLEAYARFPTATEAIEKIRQHEILEQYPSAVIDVHYVLGLRVRFDGAVLDDRVEILLREVTNAGYVKSNISYQFYFYALVLEFYVSSNDLYYFY